MANETKKLLQQVRELVFSARKIAICGVNLIIKMHGRARGENG